MTCTRPMQSIVIIRRADMVPVLECWAHELSGLVVKPEYLGLTVIDWLRGFNSAVKLAGGSQPTAEQIRRCVGA
jgi:hypothetical protein